jgi:hypothetical protein
MTISDRAHLDTFLTAIDASPTALERPVCWGWTGDWQITGKHGHVLPDGAGFLLYVSTDESPRRWTNVKRRLGFCRVTQDGDDEGCLHLDRLPIAIEAEAIREAIGIRRRRHLSADELNRRAVILERARSLYKSPSKATSIRLSA